MELNFLVLEEGGNENDDRNSRVTGRITCVTCHFGLNRRSNATFPSVSTGLQHSADIYVDHLAWPHSADIYILLSFPLQHIIAASHLHTRICQPSTCNSSVPHCDDIDLIVPDLL
jgi:hypothetical protein